MNKHKNSSKNQHQHNHHNHNHDHHHRPFHYAHHPERHSRHHHHNDVQIQPLTLEDLPQLKIFCDQEIGKNYYTDASLLKALTKSEKEGIKSSFVAYSDKKKMVGVRLTYAHGTWMHEVESGRGLSPDLWKVESESIALFKSLFIHADFQKLGLGKQMSLLAIERLKELGAKAILCHSTLQSPNNSSQRYLKSLGFEPLREHPLFWHHIDYFCTHCSKQPCVCSALEMILYL